MNTKKYLVLFLSLFLFDRVTKYLAYHYCASEFRLASFLSFNLTFNRGIAWGIFNVSDEIIFWSVSFFVMAMYSLFSIITYRSWQTNTVIIGEICILAGGISNIIDRFMYRGVIDFIIVSVNSWSWPAFNVADTAIVCGVMLIGLKWLNE